MVPCTVRVQALPMRIELPCLVFYNLQVPGSPFDIICRESFLDLLSLTSLFLDFLSLNYYSILLLTITFIQIYIFQISLRNRSYSIDNLPNPITNAVFLSN